MANYLVEQLLRQSELLRHREFCRVHSSDLTQWHSYSWTGFAEQVMQVAKALFALGLKPFDKCLLCSPNCPELLAIEYGCYLNRMATIPVYTYCSYSQFKFIADDSKPSVFFLGGPGQYELAVKYVKENPGTEYRIVLLSDKEDLHVEPLPGTMGWEEFLALGDSPALETVVMDRASQGRPDDLATLIYTSGTTGEPKGVILNHRQFNASIKEHLRELEEVEENELSLCFLPMSHIFEKAWLFYCVSKGLRVAFCRDPRNIEEVLRQTKPNVMCCVPRFWEKVYSGIMGKIDEMGWLQRRMARRAIRIGHRVNVHYAKQGRAVPPRLAREYKFWNKKFFSKALSRIGIPYPTLFPTAGAPLSDKISDFILSIGVPMRYGYGLTESVATVSCYPTEGLEIGTVGKPLSHVKVAIDHNGEILLKGDSITPGYYNNPKANADSFTNDGWFRTGDSGFMTKDGALVLSARKKDMFKTASGKYIAPGQTESAVASNRYIDEMAIVGEGKKYVSALVVPNFGYLEQWAQAQNLNYDSREELVQLPDVVNFMLDQVLMAQQDMADFEKVKRITVLDKPFRRDLGEITNTMKIRRAIISNNYAHHINAMYPDERLDEEI